MMNHSYQNYRTDEIQSVIHAAGFAPLDVLLVGATGVGKSSTLNALFGSEISTVGHGCDPETMLVNAHLFSDVLRFWDSPGLGDGRIADSEHAQKIINTLCKTYAHQDGTWGFIDLVFVILDGSSRDMGTTYRLLENVILKSIAPERVLVAINQADMAMAGRHWNHAARQPEPKLQDFLEAKSESVQARLLEATGLRIPKPVYYSAQENYNLNAVIDLIIQQIPRKKRTLENGQ